MSEARYAAGCARDQRTTLTYIFGVTSEAGKESGSHPSSCNTEAMNLHLVEITKTVTSGLRAILLVDEAR
jgi:hypothetical protein